MSYFTFCFCSFQNPVCVFHLQHISAQTRQGSVRTPRPPLSATGGRSPSRSAEAADQSHGLCVPAGPTGIPAAAAGASGLCGEESLR